MLVDQKYSCSLFVHVSSQSIKTNTTLDLNNVLINVQININ